MTMGKGELFKTPVPCKGDNENPQWAITHPLAMRCDL